MEKTLLLFEEATLTKNGSAQIPAINEDNETGYILATPYHIIGKGQFDLTPDQRTKILLTAKKLMFL